MIFWTGSYIPFQKKISNVKRKTTMSELTMTVHDGYYFLGNSNNYKDACQEIKSILSSRSNLFDLEIKVSCFVGKRFNKLLKLF